MIKHKARKEFTVSNLYSKIKIMKKKTIAIIQCILYLIAPYIALQLCRMNRSFVTDNLFFIFLILLTISFWFSIWKLEKALDNDSQQKLQRLRFVLHRSKSFLKKLYNIFPKNYNFLEKYMSLCYTTSRVINGENT